MKITSFFKRKKEKFPLEGAADLETLPKDILSSKGEEDHKEEEEEIVEIEILPEKMICPDCGGITLVGLEFCDKCGGELITLEQFL